MSARTYRDTPTRTIDVGDTTFAYRDVGTAAGVPVIFLNHLAAVLDNWDPRVVDGIATQHRVITFDNRGVGASRGKTPTSVAAMADDAIAFISIRAKTKFKGLVNVSGFHVDPGYMGQLTFAVFNAAPREIHLRQGQDIFVLWYAYLDQKTKSIKREHARLGLNIELVQGISGELESFASLGHKLKDVKTALDKTERVLSERIHSVEREQTYYRLVAALVLAVLIAVVGNWIKGEIDQRSRITPDKSMQLR